MLIWPINKLYARMVANCIWLVADGDNCCREAAIEFKTRLKNRRFTFRATRPLRSRHLHVLNRSISQPIRKHSIAAKPPELAQSRGETDD